MARRPESSEELLRYTFSPDEKQDLSDKLALACQDRYSAEEEKKSVMADFKKRIDGEAARVNHFSRLVNNGWEMRTIVCSIEYNTPVPGTKRLIRTDTGELVREVVMTAAEYQDTILFVDPKAEEKLAAKLAADRMEKSLRDFFKSTEEETLPIEPVDVSEITSWHSGAFFVAAATEEEAAAFLADRDFPLTEDLVWADPDSVYIDGFESLYGDENRSCRAAIIKLFELGRSFPCLLSFPLNIVPTKVAEDVGVEIPPAEEPEASNEVEKEEGDPAKGTKRKSRGKQEPKTDGGEPIN